MSEEGIERPQVAIVDSPFLFKKFVHDIRKIIDCLVDKFDRPSETDDFLCKIVNSFSTCSGCSVNVGSHEHCEFPARFFDEMLRHEVEKAFPFFFLHPFYPAINDFIHILIDAFYHDFIHVFNCLLAKLKIPYPLYRKKMNWTSINGFLYIIHLYNSSQNKKHSGNRGP